MRHFIILFFFSSFSLFGQETVNNHHLFIKSEIGGGYSLWKSGSTVTDYKGSGPNFNINLTPYYNYKNLMIGISYGYEQVFIDTLINTGDNFPYGTGFLNNHVSFNKISLVLGYNLIHKNKMTMGAAARFGTFRLDKSFDKKLIKNKLIAGIGFDINYMIADRVNLFVQSNFEYKYYKLDPDLIGGQNINHRISSFNCFIGVNFKIL